MVWSWLRRKRKWPEVSTEEIRKRARILVIDDSEFYYLDLFHKDGYTIEKWEDVSDLQKLESGFYDIVLLDIHGVGKAQSAEEGLGIIRHLKRVRPAQIIIAFSNADWPLKYKEFFDLADATLDKRGDYVQFKRTVDELLAQRFSLGFYIDRMASLIGASVQSEKLRTTAQRAILARDVEPLQDLLTQSNVDPERANLALGIAQTAIGILSLILR